MKILQDLSLDELTDLIKSYNLPIFRAKQIYENLQNGKTISAISNISKELKQQLLEEYVDEPIKIIHQVGDDGVTKYIYELFDGSKIEGVVMKYKYGNTLCVSTQVGCRMGCSFCASGLNGLIRNLSAGEIFSQVLVVNKLLGGDCKNRKITNVVLMGSGEPLDNYDNVVKFLRLLISPDGINISARNISLSTCGLADKIVQLSKENLQITLTISLHAPNDNLRKTIMPIANKYGLEDIKKAVAEYFKQTGRRIIFEYALINGVNDSFECAKQLAEIKGFPYHINLIPLNYVKEKNMQGTNKKQVYAFMAKLTELGVSCTVRRTLGDDVGGACGQLIASKKESE